MERNDVISLATFIASIMILIVTSFTTNFVKVIGGDNPAKGYMVLVAIGAILMCITSWIAFAKCKERHTVDMTHEEHVFKSAGKLESKRDVSDDRILVCRMYPVSDYHVIFCFYCMYYLMNPGLIATYMLVISISGMVGVMVLMPILLRKVKGSMKSSYIYTGYCLRMLSDSVLCWWKIHSGTVYPDIYCMYVLYHDKCISSDDCFRMTDYVYKTTGEQLNGTISAIGGFSYKCGTAISNAILCRCSGSNRLYRKCYRAGAGSSSDRY